MEPFWGYCMGVNLSIKNIPEDLYEDLKKSAKRHHRSINSEVIVLIVQGTQSTAFDHAEFLTSVKLLHQLTKKQPLTDKLLKKAKNWGRP